MTMGARLWTTRDRCTTSTGPTRSEALRRWSGAYTTATRCASKLGVKLGQPQQALGRAGAVRRKAPRAGGRPPTVARRVPGVRDLAGPVPVDLRSHQPGPANTVPWILRYTTFRVSEGYTAR
eukprot:3446560-Prymnesium_polylepis.2